MEIPNQGTQSETGTPAIQQLLNIVPRHPDNLIIDPKSPRKLTKKAIRHGGLYLKTFGTKVLVVTDAAGNVIFGGEFVLAARELGLKEIPTVLADDLTPAQIKALKISYYRIMELSEWDEDALTLILQELRLADTDFSLEATGFTLDEIDLRIEGLHQAETSPDDELPTPAAGPTVSSLGDLWLLGRHRLFHGDATNPEHFSTLMDGKQAQMAVTDPPYGVNYASAPKDKLRGVHRPILNDDLSGKDFEEFLEITCRNILVATTGATYVFMSSSALHVLQAAFEKAGGHWSTFIIWAKQTFTLGRADYQRQYEPMLYGWREGAERFWCGARDQGDIWFFDKPLKNDLHPTQKPVELIMRAILNSSQRGDIVL
ncbi:MAG: DNA modification methylase, partial [Alphaproteobacteria bacterium]|nr:DNA modification methylase [Alphaproteobacteria bacterium]